jgi:hypothetical protein
MFLLVGGISAANNWWSGNSSFDGKISTGGIVNATGDVQTSGNLIFQANTDLSRRLSIDTETNSTIIEKFVNGLWQPGDLEIGGHTLRIGKNVRIGAFGHNAVTESAEGLYHFLAHNENNGNITVDYTRILDVYLFEERAIFQADNSSTWTGQTQEFTIYSPAHLISNDGYVQTYTTAATEPVRYRIWKGTSDNGTLIFDQTYSANIFPALTEVQFVAISAIEFDEGETYFHRMTSDANFSLRMDVTNTTPWFASDVGYAENDPLLQTHPWRNATNYSIGDQMIYNMSLYYANQDGIQYGTFEGNLDKWSKVGNSTALNYWEKTGNILSYILGFVGIGTKNPSTELEINGSINITGSAYIGNNLTIGDKLITGDVELDLTKYLLGTGVLEGGLISKNVSNNSWLDVTAGAGVWVNYSDINNPQVEYFTWPAQEFYPNVNGFRSKWIGFQKNSSGGFELVAQLNFTQEEKRTVAVIGRCISTDGLDTCNVPGKYVTPAFGDPKSMEDLFWALGSISINGNAFSANGSNLLLDRSGGWTFRFSASFGTSPTSPNVHYNDPSYGITNYAYHLQGAIITTAESDIDPDYYDLDGVKTAVGNNKWTLQELWFFPVSRTTHVVYGQDVYNNKGDCLAGIATEDKVINEEVLDGAIRRSYLCVRQGATDLSDGDEAYFQRADADSAGGTYYWEMNGVLSPSENIPVTVPNNFSVNSTLHVDVDQGYVGIGTYNPSAELDVVGDTELNGDLDIPTGTVTISTGQLRAYGPGGTTTNFVAGHQAGADLTSGSGDTLVGYYAGNDLTTGTSNTLIGYNAGKDLIAHNFNTFVGQAAGSGVNTSNRVTGIGVQTFVGAELVSYSTGIGMYAGYNSSGQSGTYLGYNAGHSETSNGKLWISNYYGDLIEGSFINDWVNVYGDLNVSNDFAVNDTDFFVDSSTGYVGVGTNSPESIFHIWENTSEYTSEGLVVEQAGEDDAYMKFKVATGQNYNLGIAFNQTGQPFVISQGGAIQYMLLHNETFYVGNGVDFNVDNGTLFVNASNNRTGIGTTSPSAELDVVGTSEFNGDMTVNGSNINIYTDPAISTKGIYFRNSTASLKGGIYYTEDGLGDMTMLTEVPMSMLINGDFDINGDEFFIESDNGNVGIGTSTPATTLDIDSNSNAQALRIRGTSKNAEIADMYVGSAGGFIISTENGSDTGGSIVFETKAPNYGFLLRDSSGGSQNYANFYMNDATTDYLNIVVNAANSVTGLVLDDNNRVGIGTTEPSHELNVIGGGNITGNSYFGGTLDVSGYGAFDNYLVVSDPADAYISLESSRSDEGILGRVVFENSPAVLAYIDGYMHDATNQYTYLSFYTTDDDGTIERLHLEADNITLTENTDIYGTLDVNGQGSFDSHLAVSDPADAYVSLESSRTDVGILGSIVFEKSPAVLGRIDNYMYDSTNEYTDMRFYTEDSDGLIERLRLKKGANEFTGNTTISGDFNVTGTAYFAGIAGGLNVSGLINLSDTIYIGTNNVTINNDLFQRGGTSSDQYSPETVSTFNIGNDPEEIKVFGTLAYILESTASVFRVVDVHDPANPILVSTVSTASSDPEEFDMANNFAYVVDNLDGDLIVIDVVDPSDTHVESTTAVGSKPKDIAVRDGHAYIIDGTDDQLVIMDISDPAVPFNTANLSVSCTPQVLEVVGNYAYIGCWGGTVDFVIVDIADPYTPIQMTSVLWGIDILAIDVSNNYVYIAENDESPRLMHIIDATDVTAPAFMGNVSVGASSRVPEDINVVNGYAYMSTATDPEILVFDVRDPMNPALVGSSGLVGSGNSVDVVGRYAYVTEAGTHDDLQIYDISGIEVQSAKIHSLSAGSATFFNDVRAQEDMIVKGGLDVGFGGLSVDGSINTLGNFRMVGRSQEPNFYMLDDSTANEGRIHLGNAGFNFRLDDDNSIGSSFFRWYIDNDNKMNLNNQGDLTIDGTVIPGNDCGITGSAFTAEESGALTNSAYEFSFGNGGENVQSIQICAGTVTGMSWYCSTGGTATNISISADRTGASSCTCSATGQECTTTCNEAYLTGEGLSGYTVNAGGASNCVVTWLVRYD